MGIEDLEANFGFQPPAQRYDPAPGGNYDLLETRH